jgi:hypothetical protein
MAGTGKFNHVVKATSHMRASQVPAADGAGESPPAATPGSRPGESQEAKRPGPGRPRGKRSNPGYQQVTALLPSELYGRVRGRLLHDKSHGDFSDLLKTLLGSWLESTGG